MTSNVASLVTSAGASLAALFPSPFLSPLRASFLTVLAPAVVESEPARTLVGGAAAFTLAAPAFTLAAAATAALTFALAAALTPPRAASVPAVWFHKLSARARSVSRWRRRA